MSSDFVISSLLLIAAFTCRGVIATCNMTSATTCSMDAGPLRKLFIPVDGSIGECRCNVELVRDHGTEANIQFTNYMISKPNCPYKITFMNYNVELSCEKSDSFTILVNQTKPTVVFSITKVSSITTTTTTGGFCLNMKILQEKFNISCRPTSISGTTETDLTTSAESTVLNTNKDPSVTGEDHTQTNIMTTTKDSITSNENTALTTTNDPSITGEDHTQTNNMMTTTKDVLLNTSGVTSPANTNGIIISQTNMMSTTKDVLLNTSGETSTANTNGIINSTNKPSNEPIEEFPVAAVTGGIAGGIALIIIIIIIVFICFFKKRLRNNDKALSRTREDDYNYQNMQNESSENNQEAHQDQHSPAAEAPSDVIVLENDMYVSYDDSRLTGKPSASNYEEIQNVPSHKTTNVNDSNERTSSGLYTTCDVGNDFTPASKSRSGYETVDDQLFNANVGHPPQKFAPVTPDVNDNVYTLVNKKPGKMLEPDENTEVEKAPNTKSPDLLEPGLEINEKGESVVYAVSSKPRTEQQEDAARTREEDLANMYAVVDKNRSPEPEKANNQKPPVPIKPVRL